jgi:radical SAM superfamily enzyme YgiQ (UPF0313 family)
MHLGPRRIALVRAGLLGEAPRLLTHRAVVPPLGLLWLAAVLRERYPGEYELSLVDPGLEDLDEEALGRWLAALKPELVGISALASELDDVHAILRVVARVAPAARVVLGGPCTETRPEELALTPGVDCCVLGEGEETFAELVPLLLAAQPISAVRGLCLRDAGGRAVRTPPRPFIADLDAMPFPAWDLVDLGRYSAKISMNFGLLAARPYAPIFTSRGCPWHCSYCHNLFGRKVRWRSPENVLAEMSLLVARHGVREFHFFDDVFNLDGPRSERIMEEVARRGWGVKLAFPNGVRGDLMTREQLGKYAAAGTYVMSFAVETVTPRLQKEIRKNVDLERLSASIRFAREAGIIPLGFFMLGFPTETLEELRATIDWACRSALLKAYFFTVIPYEGTPLGRAVREADASVDLDPRRSYHERNPYYTRVTGVDLDRLRLLGYLRFYGNPLRLLGLFLRHPSKLGFFRNALKAGYVLFVGDRKLIKG